MRYGCDRGREEAPLRRGDELAPLARARLEAHLEACPSCRAHAARYEAAVDAARAWPPPAPAPEKEAWLDLIRARSEPPRPRGIPVRWAVAAAALPFAAALAAVVLLSTTRSPSPVGERVGVGDVEERPAVTGSVEERAGVRGSASYAAAERALAAGNLEAAAASLERVVARAPATDEAQTARLELGRLYAGPLGREGRAVVHLSEFVAREREPGARAVAKALLCRVAPASDRDRLCWPGLAAAGARE